MFIAGFTFTLGVALALLLIILFMAVTGMLG